MCPEQDGVSLRENGSRAHEPEHDGRFARHKLEMTVETQLLSARERPSIAAH